MNAPGKRQPPQSSTAKTPDLSGVPTEAIDLQISDVLGAVRYPANKDRLVDAARDAGASNELLAILDGLPEQDYAGVDDVTRLIGSNYNELLAILDGLPEQDYAGVDDVTRLIGSNYGPGLGL